MHAARTDPPTSGRRKEERGAVDSAGMEVLLVARSGRKRLGFAGRPFERPLREWHHRNGSEQRGRRLELVGEWQSAAAPG